MLYLFPLLTSLAAVASAALLVVLWHFGGLRRYGFALVLGWFLAASYCQFFGGSPVVQAAGAALQTILAVGLILRFRVLK